MRTYLKLGSNILILQDDDDSVFPEELEYADAQETQVEPILRATSPALFDRGNVLVERSFTVTREHADFATAVAYLDTHRADINAILGSGGSIVIEHAGETYIVAGGKIPSIKGRVIGLSTIITYSIKGGIIAKGTPA